jgi:peptidoglycan/LPS O-acetylase OafA/YrhL
MQPLHTMNTPSNTPIEAHRFAVLDAWRGVAALTVAASRLHIDTVLFLSPLIHHAYLLVDFFFVLSGFVIAYAYGEKIRSGISSLHFMVRRLGRLWPLHVSLLAIFVASEVARWVLHKPDTFTGTRSPVTVLADLTLTQALGFFDVTLWNTPSWSISTEFWAYAVFAVVCALGRPFKAWIAAGLIALGLGVVAAYSTTGMDVTFRLGFARCLAGFFTGVLVHACWVATRQRMQSFMGSGLELLVLGACGCFVWLAGRSGFSLLAPALFAAMVYVFAFEAGVVSRLLHAKGFQALGTWSYGIYMTAFALEQLFSGVIKHMEPMLRIALAREAHMGDGYARLIDLPWWGANMALTLAYLASVVLVSALSWRWLETPSRNWFNQQANKLPK